MSLYVIEEPTDDPITLDEAKEHLRVTVDSEDNLILGLIKAATIAIENEIDRRFITQTLEYVRDEFERPRYLGSTSLTGTKPLEIPVAPIQSILTVSYAYDASTTAYLYDTVGSPTTTSELVADLRSVPPRLMPISGGVWPTPLAQGNSIAVRFVAGYGDSGESVPYALKQAILLLIGHWYENRSSVNDAKLAEIPQGVQWILNPYKVPVFA